MKNKTDGRKPKQYRQGDLLIEAVRTVPSGAKKQEHRGPIVLALGEATGHHHTLEAQAADWWKEEGGDQFVEIASSARITHQEHGAIALEAGLYRVRRQREYSPEAVRLVQD